MEEDQIDDFDTYYLTTCDVCGSNYHSMYGCEDCNGSKEEKGE